jgi:hypothetical protein
MWANLDDDTRELAIKKYGTGTTPGSADEVLADEEWSYLFGNYLKANDATAEEFWRFATQDPDEAAKASTDGGSEADGRAQFERNRGMAVAQLEPWVAPFIDEVQRLLLWQATTDRADVVWGVQEGMGQEYAEAGPTATMDKADSLDTDYIQRVNEYSWEQAKSSGTAECLYLESPRMLLVGVANFTPHYVRAMQNSGARTVFISVDSRGGTFSRGGVTVTGVQDRSGFKKEFNKVSDKSITFK